MHIYGESGDGICELHVLERLGADVSISGDTRLHVRAAGSGVSLSSSVWVSHDLLERFIADLGDIVEGHRSSARLESLRPGELELDVVQASPSSSLSVRVASGVRSMGRGASASISFQVHRERLEALASDAATLQSVTPLRVPITDPDYLGRLLYRTLVQIRSHGYSGNAERCAVLADLTHNLPRILCARGWTQDLEMFLLEHEAFAADVDGRVIVHHLVNKR